MYVLLVSESQILVSFALWSTFLELEAILRDVLQMTQNNLEHKVKGTPYMHYCVPELQISICIMISWFWDAKLLKIAIAMNYLSMSLKI